MHIAFLESVAFFFARAARARYPLSGTIWAGSAHRAADWPWFLEFSYYCNCSLKYSLFEAGTFVYLKDLDMMSILLPLYVYPSPGAWDPLYTAYVYTLGPCSPSTNYNPEQKPTAMSPSQSCLTPAPGPASDRSQTQST